ncbi:uncharacterized protein [Montipora capricornis]|uniref:uncharacterized protein n=1 Tax=Montipora capricornis TaxID=246305 RepID=UPI0035F196A3
MDPIEKRKSNSLLTTRERDCAVKNTILRSKNDRMSITMQNERNQFTKSLDFEAKKLREKLTLLMPPTSTPAGSTTTETSIDSSKLKLPVIKRESRSVPCSPQLDGRKSLTHISLDNLNSSQPKLLEAWPRRGSSNDADTQRCSPSMIRQQGRSISGRRATLPTTSFTNAEDSKYVNVSPLMPRNLKLREFSRRESLLKELPALNQSDTPLQGDTLKDQFNSLETCRYLRQGTKEDGKEANESKEMTDTE